MRIEGHQNTTLSGDTRVDWSDAYALAPSLEVAYVWHAGVHAAAVAEGLARIGFEIASQVIWDKGLFGRRLRVGRGSARGHSAEHCKVPPGRPASAQSHDTCRAR